MGARENLQKLIDRKQEEIEELRTALTHANIYLQALQDSVRVLPKEAPSDSVSSAKEGAKLREGTMLWAARQCILAARRPLHVNELLTSMGKNADDPKARVSLTGSIGWYVREGRVFTRPSPNTFGLQELENSVAINLQPGEAHTVDLPDSFGQ